jgi:glycosyltransferase involved in cell wall biosynthesis
MSRTTYSPRDPAGCSMRSPLATESNRSMSAGTVHIVQRMAPGGIETLVLDLLRSGRPEDRVYSLEGERDGLLRAWPALEAIREQLVCFAHPGGLAPRLVSTMAKRLQTDRPAAVVAHHIGPYIYGGLAARLAGVPVLAHVEHDGWHLVAPRRRVLTRALERLLRPRHVAVSRSVADIVSRLLPTADVRVVTNGIDLVRFVPADKVHARRRLGLPLDVRLVGSVGRLVPVKGHDVLVQAVRALPEEVHVVIVGDGSEGPSLRQLADDLGTAARVHFIGHRDDIPDVLPAFDVFCLPSRSEGLPRSVIEAQACGLPVVASDVGGVGEAVCRESGRLVPASDSRALAAALREVLNAPAIATPRAFVEQRFAWQQTLAGYAAVTGARHAA